MLALVLALPLIQNPAAPPKVFQEPWLIRHQEADGRWDADGYLRHSLEKDPVGDPGGAERDVRVTALSMLVLMQEGDLTSGPFRRSLRRATDWLLGQREGIFGLGGEEHPGQLQDHALGTLALVELLALNDEPALRAGARDWVNALEFARHADGGWARGPGLEPDALTTGWAMLALRRAERTGLAVSYRAMREGDRFLKRCFDLQRGLVALHPGEEARGLSPTALALLSVQLAGRQPDDQAWLVRARAALAAAGAGATVIDGKVDWEAAYTVGLVAYLSGGRFWEDWSRGMKVNLLEHAKTPAQVFGPAIDSEPGGTLGALAWSRLGLGLYFHYTRVIGR